VTDVVGNEHAHACCFTKHCKRYAYW